MESRPAARVPRMHDIGPRQLTSLYVAGPFSMGYVDFFTFLMPLYGLSLGLDASEIGRPRRARSILALFLSLNLPIYPASPSASCAISVCAPDQANETAAPLDRYAGRH